MELDMWYNRDNEKAKGSDFISHSKKKISYRIADFPDIDPNQTYREEFLKKEGYTLVANYSDLGIQSHHRDVTKTFGVPINVIVTKYNYKAIREYFDCHGQLKFHGEEDDYAIFSDNDKTIKVPLNTICNFYEQSVREFFVFSEKEITSRRVGKNTINFLENSFKEERQFNTNNYSHTFLSFNQITVLEEKDKTLDLMSYYSEEDPKLYISY